MKTLFLSLLIATIFFASIVSADPLVQVNASANPSPISAGTEGSVQLALTNAGTTSASNIQVTGMSSDPSIQVSPSGIVNLGALASSKSTTAFFKFTVSSSAPSGLYTISFTVNYCSTGCTEVVSTAVVTVQSPSSLQIVSVQPDTLAAGQTTTLTFNLANEGSDTINNIVLSWQMPDNEILPLGTSNRQYISSLSGGSSLSIPINVSVGSSVSPGIYPLSMQLVYYDKSGVKQNITSTVGIKIGGTTDFDVGVQQYSTGALTLSIANIGVNPATSVSVSIPKQDDYTTSGAASSFIGTLNAGDFSVASFTVSSTSIGMNTSGGTRPPTTQIQNNTRRASSLIVQISYSDTSGGRQIVQKEVSMDSSFTSALDNTQSGGIRSNRGLFGSLEIIVIIIVIVIVAVVVWYFKFRKKKGLMDLLKNIFGKFHK